MIFARYARFLAANVSVIGAVSAAVPAAAQSIYMVNLPKERMDTSLRALGSIMRVTIAFDPETVRGLIAPPLRGAYQPEQAIRLLLQESGLGVRVMPSGSFLILTDTQSTARLGARARKVSAIAEKSLPEPAPARDAHIPAREAAPVVADIQEAMNQDIVVTSRKRPELLQDVPISISAFDSRVLRNTGVSDVTDLAKLTPNISLSETRGLASGSVSAFIRGIGNDPGTAQGVGLYIDDVYLSRPLMSQLQLMDIERIEILKGPQGQLYGRNTIAGAIRYITKNPTPEFRGALEARYGRFDHKELRLSASGPIIANKLGASFAMMARKRDGYQKSIVDDRTYNGSNLQTYRAKLIFTPTEDLSIKLVADHVHDESSPNVPIRLGVVPGSVAFTGNINTNGNAILPGAGLLQTPNDVSLGTIDQARTEFGAGYDQWKVKATTASAIVEWDASQNIRLKSVSSLRWGSRVIPYDYDGTDQLLIRTLGKTKEHDFSQEFQINYDSEAIKGVGGLFYLDTIDKNPSTTLSGPRLNGARLRDTVTTRLENTLKSKAVYGSVDFYLGEWSEALSGLQLSIGGRYTHDRIGISRDSTIANTDYPVVTCLASAGCAPSIVAALARSGGLATINPAMLAAVRAVPGVVFLGCGFPTSMALCGSPIGSAVIEDNSVTQANLSTSSATWNFRIAYKAAPDALLYAGVSTGYKQGGINAFSTTSAPVYQPEKVTSYAAGLKTSLFDRSLRVNIEGFYNSYQNKQLSILTLVGSQLSNSTENAGKAVTYGVEVESIYVPPIKGLTLAANFGWLNTRFDKFLRFVDLDAGAAVVPGQIDVAKDYRLGFAPKVTAQFRAAYDQKLRAGTLSLSSDVSYRSSSFTDSPIALFNVAAGLVRSADPLVKERTQKAHAIWNGRIGFKTNDQRWNFAVEVQNITDKRVPIHSFRIGSIVGGGFNTPRLWQLVAGYTF